MPQNTLAVRTRGLPTVNSLDGSELVQLELSGDRPRRSPLSQIYAFFADIVSRPTVRTVTGTTDTILSADLGNAVRYTSGDPVTVSVPSGLGEGFTCLLLQAGAGTVTVAAGAGATVVNRQTQFDAAGQWAVCSLFADEADHLIFGGDTA